MKIGILSDTHNNVENTHAALELFREQGVTTLLHCGDLIAPKMMRLFQGWDVTFVIGNVDVDIEDTAQAAQKIGAPVPRAQYSLTLDGVTIMMVHGNDDEALQSAIESQRYRLVCCGHTHRRRNELIRQTRVVNPGALGGRRVETRSVAIVDLGTLDVAFYEIA